MLFIRRTHVIVATAAISFLVCAHASLRSDLTPKINQLETFARIQ